jgi:hypothetical protein
MKDCMQAPIVSMSNHHFLTSVVIIIVPSVYNSHHLLQYRTAYPLSRPAYPALALALANLT